MVFKIKCSVKYYKLVSQLFIEHLLVSKYTMEDCDKKHFKNLLHDKFNNNLKAVNEALVKYMELVEKKKEANKNAYRRNKDNDDFKQKKKNYDKQYYNEHKQDLLNARKIKYHSDKEYREQVKQQSKQIKQP